MQRILTGLGDYASNLALSVYQGWNSFWYTPADPTLLGLMRIFTGLLLLYTHAVWGLAIYDFFGPESWISRDLVQFIQSDQIAYTFWWWVPAKWLWLAYGLAMIVLFCFTVGFFTRVTSVLALVVVISYAHRVPEALFGLDKMNLILTLYLAIGPSGAALSIDRWMRARRTGAEPAAQAGRVGANFAQRLIQVHLCIVYFFAGISKLQGVAWWNGQAMWLAFGNLEYQAVDMTWIAWHPFLVHFLTHFSVLWELSFGVLVWVRLLRPLILAGAVVLHVGIGFCLGLWTFSLAMLIGCASFLPNEGVADLVAALYLGRARALQAAERPESGQPERIGSKSPRKRRRP
jgi:hypothetical protein